MSELLTKDKKLDVEFLPGHVVHLPLSRHSRGTELRSCLNVDCKCKYTVNSSSSLGTHQHFSHFEISYIGPRPMDSIGFNECFRGTGTFCHRQDYKCNLVETIVLISLIWGGLEWPHIRQPVPCLALKYNGGPKESALSETTYFFCIYQKN